MYQKILLNKVKEYLIAIDWNINKRVKPPVFICPFCNQNSHTANQIPNNEQIHCYVCKKMFNLLDMIRVIEPDKKNYTDEELYAYLKDLLKVDVTTKTEADELEKILLFFEENKFDLVPVAKNAKNPIETGWTNKVHKTKNEWEQWLINGLNVGVKTGQCSGIIIIDIDAMPTKIKEQIYTNTLSEKDTKQAYLDRDNSLNKVLEIFGHPEKETLTQKSLGGVHLIFKYDGDLPKASIIVENVHIDIENNGGQVIIQPSIVAGTKRIFDFKPIQKMSEELKKLLLEKMKSLPKKIETVNEEIVIEHFTLDMFKEGERNSSLIKLGGIFRKGLSAKQTGLVLHTLNNHNSNPLPYKEVDATVRKLEHYIQYDEDELARDIIDYLKLAETASKAEIEIAILGKRATGEDKKRIDKTLVFLIKEEKLAKKLREYKLIKSMEWTDTILDVGIPIDFKVPYLDEQAFFNWGDLIIIGSQNKYGKTTLAMNVVKKLVEQGIKPYYIYSESGGRFAKTAWKLGMKDGDFWKLFCGDPEDITLEPNSVTIYDWVRPPDFAKTDKLYDSIVQKLEKAKGVMICFVQLKKDNKWFAENMITQYPAIACKYIYENDGDGTNTKFDITEVRDAKSRGKSFTVPCRYEWETKEVIQVDPEQNESGKTE